MGTRIRAFVYCSAKRFGEVVAECPEDEYDKPDWMPEPPSDWHLNQFGLLTNGQRLRSGVARLIKLRDVSVQRHSLGNTRYHVVLDDGVCAPETYTPGPWLPETLQLESNLGPFTVHLMDDVPIGAVVDGPHVLISHHWQDNHAHMLIETMGRFWSASKWPAGAPLIWEIRTPQQRWLADTRLAQYRITTLPAERTLYRELYLPMLRTPYCVSPAQVQFLREFLKQNASSSNRRLYVSRSDATSRRITNEPELFEALRARGFTCVTLGGMPLAEQASLFSEAEVIVAPHGAAMANLLFAGHPRVVELVPRGYEHPMFGLMAIWSGMDYHRLVYPSAEGTLDMCVDVGEVLAAIG